MCSIYPRQYLALVIDLSVMVCSSGWGGNHADNRISLRGNGVLWLSGLKRVEMCGTVEHTVETH